MSIVHAERTSRSSRGRCSSSRAASARSSSLLNAASNAILRLLRVDPSAARRRAGPRGAQAADRRVLHRRQARPGRGRDALRRLPPARAGGAPGDDADPRRRHRRRWPRTSRPRCGAASARATRASWSPRTRTSDRVKASSTPTRWPGCSWPRARRDARGARPRRADRARRPSRSTTCWPTSSASASRWRSSSTSTAASAGIVTVEDIIEEVVGEIDDETDPAGGAVRRLANGDWFVRGHVAVTDLHDYGLDAAGRHRRLQLGRRLRLRRARPAAQARRHDHRRRLLDPRRVGAREPHRGGPHPSPRRGRPAQRRRGGAMTLRPEIAVAVERAHQLQVPPLSVQGVDGARATDAQTGSSPVRPKPVAEVADRSIDGPGPIPIRVYRPTCTRRPAPSPTSTAAAGSWARSTPTTPWAGRWPTPPARW